MQPTWPHDIAPLSTRNHGITRVAALMFGIGVGATQAQQIHQRVLIQPFANLIETFTDNVALTPSARTADAVTKLTAGVGIKARTGHAVGFLDYSLSGLVYANRSQRSTLQSDLNTKFDVEWFDRQGYLTLGAAIARVPKSAFGAPVRVDGLPTSNSVTSRTLQLTPRWTGLAARDWRIDALLDTASSRSSTSGSGNGSQVGVTAGIAPVRPGKLNWSITAAHQRQSFDSTRSTAGTSLSAGLVYDWSDQDLKLGLNGGYENSNLTRIESVSRATIGASALWQPSPRAKVQARADRRAFGDTYSAAAEYRTPTTIWRASASRGVTSGGATLVPGQRGLAFDVFFAQLASIEPDFAKRADLVDALLLARGLKANDIVTTGFLRSAATFDTRHELSAGWIAQRMTALIKFGWSHSQRADKTTSGSDDLDLSSEVMQRDLTSTISYRLNPELLVSMTVQDLASRGLVASLSNHQRSVGVQLGGRITTRDSWSLVLRRALIETNQLHYPESTLVATYGIRF